MRAFRRKKLFCHKIVTINLRCTLELLRLSIADQRMHQKFLDRYALLR